MSEDSWDFLDTVWVRCTVEKWSYMSSVDADDIKRKKLVSELVLIGKTEMDFPKRSYQCVAEIEYNEYEHRKLDDENFCVGAFEYYGDAYMQLKLYLPDYTFFDLFDCLKEVDHNPNKVLNLYLALYKSKEKIGKRDWEDNPIYCHEYNHRLLNK